jgi:hypothetical protein
VLPRLRQQLLDRAFEVDDMALNLPERVTLRDYDGLVLGCPVPGAGLRRHGPTPLIDAFVRAQDQLDEVETALFTVFRARAGHTLRNTRQLVVDQGGRVVVQHAYSVLRPQWQEHVLPAECMVRIRTTR